MLKLTTAQQLMMALGVEPSVVVLGRLKESSRNNRKSGPGRMPMRKGAR